MAPPHGHRIWHDEFTFRHKNHRRVVKRVYQEDFISAPKQVRHGPKNIWIFVYRQHNRAICFINEAQNRGGKLFDSVTKFSRLWKVARTKSSSSNWDSPRPVGSLTTFSESSWTIGIASWMASTTIPSQKISSKFLRIKVTVAAGVGVKCTSAVSDIAY